MNAVPFPAPDDDAWRDRANCFGEDYETFFPTPGDHTAVAVAVAICTPCRARDDCLAYALANSLIEGVWGGTTEDQRKTLRRRALREWRVRMGLSGRASAPRAPTTPPTRSATRPARTRSNA